MEAIGSTNDLRVEISYKQIFHIALPITLAILVPQVNFVVNTIFLGHLNEESLGNAGITGVYYLIFALAANGLNSAMQTVFSRFAGSGDIGMFRYTIAQGIRLSLIFSAICILFTWLAAPYILSAVADKKAFPVEMGFLRIRILGIVFLFIFQICNAFLVASLNSRLLITAFIVETVLNIILDYGLIFGKLGMPKLGFNGAAYASVIAELSGMITVVAVIYKSGLQKKYQLFSNFKYHRNLSREIVRVALPLVSQFMISATTWLAFFLLIEPRGEQAKAISNVMRIVYGITGIFIWALSGTTNVMVSNLMGQHRQQDIFPLLKKIVILSVSCCLFICLLINLFPAQFFNLFGQDESFVVAGIPVIRVVSLGILLLGIANPFLNAVTGTGKTKVNLGIEVIAIAIYMVYTWYFMVIDYRSLAMGWTNEFVYWTTIFLFSFFYMRSGKWKTSKIYGE